MSGKEIISLLTLTAGLLFLMSELTKNPRKRILLSKESKLVSLAADIVSFT